LIDKWKKGYSQKDHQILFWKLQPFDELEIRIALLYTVPERGFVFQRSFAQAETGLRRDHERGNSRGPSGGRGEGNRVLSTVRAGSVLEEWPPADSQENPDLF
jgi:hypothetical protein